MNKSSELETTPALSIITPVYNGEKFISNCIESVVAQNCASVEHIVVDGGSTDRTSQILREKAEKYHHLRWISEPDQGQSDAMNKGVNMARAEYIGFLNVDDFHEPGTLSRVSGIIKELTEPKFIVGACNVLTVNDELLFVNRPRVLKFKNIMVDDGVWPFPHNPSAYFYPKAVHEIVGPYNVTEHFAMDFEFILAAIQAVEPIYIDAVLGNFRLIPGTKTYDASLKPDWRHMHKIRKAAWRRAPLKIKIQVAILWALHRPKRTYWKFRRHLMDRV